MTQIELLYGGFIEVDETNIIKAYFDNELNGIVLKSNDGLKITIKDSDINRDKWCFLLENG